jgi:ATP-dependent Clp protease ATP-binding subunit ClpC
VSKRVKRVLRLSVREATKGPTSEITSGHLLLGILLDGEGPAIELLRQENVQLELLHAEVGRLLGDQAA